MTKQFTHWLTLSVIGILLSGNLVAQVWQMGYASMTFTDPSRGNRQIPAEVYYPADVTGINSPLGSPFDKRYPVIVFGHDEATPYYNYQYISDRLTPKGFIVVKPLTEMGANMDVEEFAKDLAFIALHFKAMNLDPNSFYYKRHNNKSCIMGHGKGGSAAILATQYYPNVTTLVTLAANETIPSVIAAASQVTAPAVVVAGGEDCLSPVGTVQEGIFNNLNSDCKTLINLTTAPRCHFAQNALNCTSTELLCGGPIPYIWQKHAFETTYYLVSFMRYYMKSNAPALAKFEWKLQQKVGNDMNYVMSCAMNAPRVAWQPEDADIEEFDVTYDAFAVKLYPNPVSSGSNVMLEVESEFETQATVMITDLMGKLVSKTDVVLNENYSEVSVPTTNLSKGAYMISITGLEGRTTKPLIIN